MRVLSLHSMGHDAGVSYFEDGRLRFSIETERLTRRKHDHRVEIALRHWLAQGFDPDGVDLIAVSTPVRSRVLRIPDLDRAMEAVLGGALHHRTTSHLLGRPVDCVVVTHEVSHAALAAHYAGYPDGGLVLVNEGRGQVSRSSLFRLQGGGLEWMEMDPLPWYGNGFGWSALGHLFGFGKDPGVAGTIMAIGGYGEPSGAVRELLAAVDPRVSEDPDLAEQVRRDLGGRPEFRGGFQAMADVICTFQDMFTERVHALLAAHGAGPRGAAVALGGGCALNIVTNAVLRDRFASDIAIPPACGDAGHPLGAGLYAQRFVLNAEVEPFDVYANGVAETVSQVSGTLAAAGLTARPYDPAEVARSLAAGEVVAMVDGAAELGPRALGNRSLLGDPSVPGMRKKLSEELKQREWFRPLGAVMRLDRFHALFPGRHPSPHMLFSYPLPDGWLPEARHADGTSRIQTVSSTQHPRLHDLLHRFEAESGVPALINTSLNSRGRAIAHGVQDVLDDFLGQDVDVFVFGELMVRNPRRGGGR